MMTLFEVAKELARRLVGIFLRDEDGTRPVYGGTELFQEDPHWRDLILFYEYFHGDNGAGPRRLPPDRLDRPGGHTHPELRGPRRRRGPGGHPLAASPPLPPRPQDSQLSRAR